jgi:hypothetical protein
VTASGTGRVVDVNETVVIAFAALLDGRAASLVDQFGSSLLAVVSGELPGIALEGFSDDDLAGVDTASSVGPPMFSRPFLDLLLGGFG